MRIRGLHQASICAVATAMGYKDLYLTGIDFYQEGAISSQENID